MKMTNFSVSRWMSACGGAAGVVAMFVAGLPVAAQAEPARDLEVSQRAELSGVDAIAVGIESTRVLSLADARKSARTQNFSVQRAQVQRTIADAAIRQAWAALHPQLLASGSYTVNEDEVSFSPAPNAEPIVVQPRQDYRWSVSASLRANFRSYPLIRQAYAQRELAEAQVEVVRESLDLSVVDVYYNLVSVRQLIVLASQQLASNQTMLRATEVRRRAEMATEFELTRAKLRVVQAEQNLERARLQFVQLRSSAAQLFQTPADFDVVEPPPVRLPESLDGLKADAEKNRATLKANSLEQLVAERAIEEIYWQYLPVFSATFTYAGAKGSLLNPGDPRWMLSFGADWTLWDGGIRGAQADQRRAQLLASEISRREQLMNISTELDRAWAQYLTAKTQVESSIIALELAGISLEQAEKGYQYGVSSQLDLINAQDQLEIARISQIQEKLALDLSIQQLLLMAEPVHEH